MLADPANSPQSRLVIDRIVVTDFKSYLGRHVLGPFHRSFSAIVGPNGSGKSNVIDALMFVLGSRAKRLRQGKLSELIHVSEGAEDIESCTVEVHFVHVTDTDTGSTDAVPGSEFSVSRTAYRNSRNVYHVNGQTSSHNEVVDLLKSHGVDLDHKRFLILQGEVELISQMKPKGGSEHEEGLLEYLEDIIGTAHYAAKIEVEAEKVDAANMVSSEKLIRTRHAERELSLLQEEKDQAEVYLNLENSIVSRKAELFQVLRFQVECNLRRSQAAFKAATEALKSEQVKNGHQITTVDQIECELREKSSRLSGFEREFTELGKRMKRLENEDVSLREKKAFLKKKLAVVGKGSAESEKKKGEAERELGNLAVEQTRLEKQISELQFSIATNEEELAKLSEGLMNKTESLQSQLAELQSEIEPWRERLRDAQTAFELASASMQSCNRRLAAGDDEAAKLETSIDQLEKDREGAAEVLKQLKVQQRDLQKQSGKNQEQRLMAENKLDQVTKDISALQATIGEAKESIVSKHSQSGSAAVHALIRDAKRIVGDKSGAIYGRLGDLGVIDERYDVAVSTASPQLNYVVVDTTETGQKCVEYLKKNNLGRASFIILEQMRLSPPSPPQNATRLFDLVGAKDRQFLSAFYFALGETLVADDMEAASKLAYNGPKRQRVVTIDGKLIDVSGAMSGGGRSQQRGAMRLKKSKSGNAVPTHQESEHRDVTEEQVQQLDQVLRQKQEEQRILKSMIQEFHQALIVLGKELKVVGLEIAKNEQLITALPVQVDDMRRQLDSLKSQAKDKQSSDSKELVKSTKEVEAKGRALKQAQEEIAPIQAQLDQVQEKIMAAGGVKYKVQRAKVDSLKEQKQLAEARLAKVAAEVSVLSGSLAPTDSNKGDRRVAEEAALVKEIKQIDAEVESKTTEATTVKARLTELQGLIDDLKEAVDDMKKAVEQHNKTLAKFKKHEFELKLRVEELEGECGAAEESVKRYAQSLSSLKLNDLSKEYSVEINTLSRELPVLDENELSGYTKRDVEHLQQEVADLEGRLANIANPNIAVLQVYARQHEAYLAVKEELATADAHRHAVKAELEGLRRNRFDEFMSGLRSITQHLKQLYQLLTMGGNADLELLDTLDPFAEGVQFSVMPPKKSWKAIANLSGGEKTLASLALIFALHAYKPTPIYIMDEIDAALDYRNVSIVANYIKARTLNAQFIVISLRNDMFEPADRLVGVYKVGQRTRSVVIDPRSPIFC